MKDKKIICYILAIFVLFSIAITPVIADDFSVEKKIISEKLSKENNSVIAKAATTATNDSTSNSNSNSSTNSNTNSSNSNSNTNTNTTCNTNTSNNNNNSTVSSNNKSNSTTQSTTNTNTGNAKPKKLTQAQILKASVYVNSYVTKYKKLPNTVTIGGYTFSIPEYTYLLGKTIYYKYNKKNTDVVIKYDIKNPTKPTGTKIKGKLTSKQYYTYIKNLLNYIGKNNRIPNYVTTKLGKMQYQTVVYGFNRILYWSYNNKGKVPTSLTLNVAKTHKMNKVIPKYTRPQSFVPQTSTQTNTSNSGSNNFITVTSKFSCGPTEVKYNSECLISTGKCSCGKTGDYCYHTASFKNYCPYCKIDGKLIYEEGSSCPEGMWVCIKCDADFCLVTGKEHVINSPKYLTPY